MLEFILLLLLYYLQFRFRSTLLYYLLLTLATSWSATTAVAELMLYVCFITS